MSLAEATGAAVAACNRGSSQPKSLLARQHYDLGEVLIPEAGPTARPLAHSVLLLDLKVGRPSSSLLEFSRVALDVRLEAAAVGVGERASGLADLRTAKQAALNNWSVPVQGSESDGRYTAIRARAPRSVARSS